jgi:spermidine/putrescine transport system substrate-binding protein
MHLPKIRKLTALIILVVLSALAYQVWQTQVRVQTVPNVIPKKITLLNWVDYTSKPVLDEFEKETGIQVVLEEYTQSNEMFSRFYANPGKYDIVIVDDFALASLNKARLLATIDTTQLSNFSNMRADFVNQHFDPHNTLSVPYLFGTTGLGINTQYVKDPIDSWTALLNPAYAGKVALFDEPSEVVIPLLELIHKPLNAVPDAEVLDQMERVAHELRANGVILAKPQDTQSMLVAGQVWISMAYSGDLLGVIEENPQIKYVIPKEGSNKWIDSYVMSKQTKNKDAVYLFLNFMMRPDIAAKITNELRYASPNKAATRYLEKNILSNPVVYPSELVLNTLEFIHDTSVLKSQYNRLFSVLEE